MAVQARNFGTAHTFKLLALRLIAKELDNRAEPDFYRWYILTIVSNYRRLK